MNSIDKDRMFICDYIDIIRSKTPDDIDEYLILIQNLAQRMEDVLRDRKEKLFSEGYIKCPRCGTMSKPDYELGLNYFYCCGYFN